MKTEKLSLSSIKNVLSRDEMRKITAGSGGGYCQGEGSNCAEGLGCCKGLMCGPGNGNDCLPCAGPC